MSDVGVKSGERLVGVASTNDHFRGRGIVSSSVLVMWVESSFSMIASKLVLVTVLINRGSSSPPSPLTVLFISTSDDEVPMIVVVSFLLFECCVEEETGGIESNERDLK